jgi:hypothetical protein
MPIGDDRPFIPAVKPDDEAAQRAAIEQWSRPTSQFVQARQGGEDYPSNFYQQRPGFRDGTPTGRQQTPAPEVPQNGQGGRATYGPSGIYPRADQPTDPQTGTPRNDSQLPPVPVAREPIRPQQPRRIDNASAGGGISNLFNFGTVMDYALTGGAVGLQHKYRLPEVQKVVGNMSEETELALEKSLSRYHNASNGYLKILQDKFKPLEEELAALTPKGSDLRELANDEALSKAFRETLEPNNRMRFDQYQNFAKEWNRVGEWTISTEVPANKFDLKAGTPPKPAIPFESVIGTTADNPWSIRRASLEGISVQNFEKAAGHLAGDIEKASTERFAAGNKLTTGFWTKAGLGYGADILYDLNTNKKPAGPMTSILDVAATFSLLKPWGLIKTTATIAGAHWLGRSIDNMSK